VLKFAAKISISRCHESFAFKLSLAGLEICALASRRASCSPPRMAVYCTAIHKRPAWMIFRRSFAIAAHPRQDVQMYISQAFRPFKISHRTTFQNEENTTRHSDKSSSSPL
jgi:hypothetical protein